MKEFSIDDVIKAKESYFDLENKVLYDLCTKYPSHSNEQEIIAKVVLIGRTYSVSLDRRKNKDKDVNQQLEDLKKNTDFYTDIVIPKFKDSELDNMIQKLAGIYQFDEDTKSNDALRLFNYLAEKLEKINSEKKISFCSKYLHFHLPDIFFIYDSRSLSVIDDYIESINLQDFKKKKYTGYELFFRKSLIVQQNINSRSEIKISPRYLDNLFMKPANEKLRLFQIQKLKKSNQN